LTRKILFYTNLNSYKTSVSRHKKCVAENLAAVIEEARTSHASTRHRDIKRKQAIAGINCSYKCTTRSPKKWGPEKGGL